MAQSLTNVGQSVDETAVNVVATDNEFPLKRQALFNSKTETDGYLTPPPSGRIGINPA